jgi:hypothetical protein
MVLSKVDFYVLKCEETLNLLRIKRRATPPAKTCQSDFYTPPRSLKEAKVYPQPPKHLAEKDIFGG